MNRGKLPGCCARAASGHAAAAPPSSVARNFRRPMLTVMCPSRARVRKTNDTTPPAYSLHVQGGQDRAGMARSVPHAIELEIEQVGSLRRWLDRHAAVCAVGYGENPSPTARTRIENLVEVAHGSSGPMGKGGGLR